MNNILRRFCDSKLRLLAILVSLGLNQVALAQVQHPYLFKVSSPSGTSYLFGTIHVGVGIEEFPAGLVRLIQKSRIILPEIDLTDDELVIYESDPFRVLANHNPFFQANLDEKSKRRLIGLGYPKYLVDTLGDSDCGALAPLIQIRNGKVPLDIQVLELAHELRLKVNALDTIELRRRARQLQNKDAGSCSLKSILESDSDDQLLERLAALDDRAIEVYRRGKPIRSKEADSPLAVFRNLAWLPTVTAEVARGGAFISVGAAHLFGSKGLINLLEDAGFEVTRVNASQIMSSDEFPLDRNEP